MKTFVNHIKEIGIVLSYLWMLVACYLFDWKPFAVFISHLIEIIVLLLVYIVLRIIDERKNPEQSRKAQPIINILIGILPLIVLQYFIIGWMSSFINPEQNFLTQNLLMTKEVYYAFGAMIFLYTINAVQIANHDERLNVFQNNFMFSVLALSGANILGFVLVVGMEVKSLLPILTVMVAVRIALEIYWGRK